MRLIPVMDLKNGQVVHAVKGERAHYQPVTSNLITDSDPQALAQAFEQQLGLHELYVADLDAIQCFGQHRACIVELARRSGLTIMVDAGAANVAQAREVLALGVHKAVIGSETLADWDEFRAMNTLLPPGQLVFSLDLRGGRVVANCRQLARLRPLEVLAGLNESSCREVILLDLARVGTGCGVDLELMAQAHARYPRLRLLAGGGVRNLDDLKALQAAGAAGALIATALHLGVIGRQEIAELDAG